MPWLITFVLSWALFLIFIDRTSWKKGVLGGIFAILLAMVTDIMFVNMGYYSVKQKLINLWGASGFFNFGLVFTMGALFVQNIPPRLWHKISNILVFAGLFLLEENLLLFVGALEYHNWHQGLSFYINVLVFTCITWLSDSLNLNRAAYRG